MSRLITVSPALSSLTREVPPQQPNHCRMGLFGLQLHGTAPSGGPSSLGSPSNRDKLGFDRSVGYCFLCVSTYANPPDSTAPTIA